MDYRNMKFVFIYTKTELSSVISEKFAYIVPDSRHICSKGRVCVSSVAPWRLQV